MATSLAPCPTDLTEHRARPASSALQVLEFVRIGSSVPRRFELDARRTARGVEFECWCQPAPEGLQVEVCAGDVRLARTVPTNGRLKIDGLPPDCRHLKVFVRGGGLPPLVFLKLPVE